MAQEVDFNEPVITTSDGLDKITIVSPTVLCVIVRYFLTPTLLLSRLRFTIPPIMTWSPFAYTRKTTR